MKVVLVFVLSVAISSVSSQGFNPNRQVSLMIYLYWIKIELLRWRKPFEKKF